MLVLTFTSLQSMSVISETYFKPKQNRFMFSGLPGGRTPVDRLVAVGDAEHSSDVQVKPTV